MSVPCKVAALLGLGAPRLARPVFDFVGGIAGAENMAVGVFASDAGAAPCARALEVGYGSVLSIETEAALDYLGQALLLQAAMREFCPDLIVCDQAFQSRAVAGALAFLLGKTCVSGVLEVKVSKSLKECEVLRQGDHGIAEFVCPLPCVLSLSSQASPAPLKAIARAQAIRSVPAQTLLPADLLKERIEPSPQFSQEACELYSDAGAVASRLWRGR